MEYSFRGSRKRPNEVHHYDVAPRRPEGNCQLDAMCPGALSARHPTSMDRFGNCRQPCRTIGEHGPGLRLNLTPRIGATPAQRYLSDSGVRVRPAVQHVYVMEETKPDPSSCRAAAGRTLSLVLLSTPVSLCCSANVVGGFLKLKRIPEPSVWLQVMPSLARPVERDADALVCGPMEPTSRSLAVDPLLALALLLPQLMAPWCLACC